ncbi:MAG: hypothetical protein LIO43_06410 [Clostridiales bacterium]|nr:hypothetical protein [Clostridiales bacterium]
MKKKIIKLTSGIGVAIIILNFIIELILGEQVVSGNENLRLFFAFFPTIIVLSTLSIDIIIDAVFKCRKYEKEEETETVKFKISKKNFYVISTSVLIISIISYAIISFFMEKENALFLGGPIRTLWIIFSFVVVAVVAARYVILKKVYLNANVKMQND